MTAPSIVRLVPDGDFGSYALTMVWDDANGKWVPSTTGGLASTQVQGTAADGAAAVGNPVQAGGVDGSGNMQAFAVDTSGNQVVVGNVASGVADTGAPVKVAAKYNGTLPTFVDGQRADLQVNNFGGFIVCTRQAGADAASNANVSTMVTGAAGFAASSSHLGVFSWMFNGASWDRNVKANLTARLLSSAATVNNTLVKNAAGNLHKIRLNVAVTGKFLKLFNKASAPAAGTDTPVLTIALPTAGFVDIDFGNSGLYFGTGIGYAITGAAADADTTAVASGDITCLNITYS